MQLLYDLDCILEIIISDSRLVWTYSYCTMPLRMVGELCNQNVLRLFGADDVVVELLVDVGGGFRAFGEIQKD